MHCGGADPDEGICRRPQARRARGQQPDDHHAARVSCGGRPVADLCLHAACRHRLGCIGGGAAAPDELYPHHGLRAAGRGGGIPECRHLPGDRSLRIAGQHEHPVQCVLVGLPRDTGGEVGHQGRRHRFLVRVAFAARHEHPLCQKGALSLPPDARPQGGLCRHLL